MKIMNITEMLIQSRIGIMFDFYDLMKYDDIVPVMMAIRRKI